MLETERLLIRRFMPTDGPGLYAYLSDPEVVRFEPYMPFTREACDAEAARRAEDPSFHAVCLHETGALLGNLYLDRQAQDTWELGYVFARHAWGHGYATEAARALLTDVFGRGAHRVYAQCDPRNRASWRLLERLGMRREAHLLQNVYFTADPTPQWQDTYIYAILRDEWKGFLAKSSYGAISSNTRPTMEG